MRPRAAILDERLALCRAVRDGADTLREAITSLDAAGLHPDAARASALLARMTGDAADRKHAMARLAEFADRAYQSRIDEPFIREVSQSRRGRPCSHVAAKRSARRHMKPDETLTNRRVKHR